MAGIGFPNKETRKAAQDSMAAMKTQERTRLEEALAKRKRVTTTKKDSRPRPKRQEILWTYSSVIQYRK